jgi:phage I-like protein
MPGATLVTALLAAALDVAADGSAQLLPAGEFRARDGRPGEGMLWSITDEQGRALAAAMNAVAALTPIVVDYDHATMTTHGTGNPAPAAGWIHSVDWVDGQGLFASVEWTERASALIRAREYRYISPVIEFDALGQITGVLMAALVNHPALLGMDAVQAALSGLARRAATSTDHRNMTTTTDKPVVHLDAAGAAAGTTAAQIAALQAELTTLRARPMLTAALCAALGIDAAATEAVALSAVTKLVARAGAAEGALQQVVTLQGELAQLRTAQADADIVSAVDGAIAAGKFVPAQRDTLLATGRADRELLAAWITNAKPIAALAGTNDQAGRAAAAAAAGGAAPAMTAEARHIAALMGVTQDEYLKHQAARAAQRA